MKNRNRFVSLIMVPLCILPLLSGCQSQLADSTPSGNSNGNTSSGFTIAANNWGVGAYPLDIIFEGLAPLEASAGDLTIDVANNEFKADKVISDLQNQLSSGADGVLFLGMTQTIFPTAFSSSRSQP